MRVERIALIKFNTYLPCAMGTPMCVHATSSIQITFHNSAPRFQLIQPRQDLSVSVAELCAWKC